MQLQSIKKPIAGLFIIGFSSYIYYLFGYRKLILLDTFFAIANVFGWLAVFSGLSAFLQPVKQPTIGNNKPAVQKKWTGCLSLFGFMFLFIGNFVGIFFLTDYRVANILATQPTKQTNATVVEIKVNHGKGGSTAYAVVHYNTDSESLTQELPYKYHKANIGDQFTILYSIDHPHMIKVVQPIYSH